MNVKRASCCIAIASVLVAAFPARANADGVEADMRGYYRGEQRSAYAIGGLGVVAVGAGGALLAREGDFEKGLGASLLALGGLEAIGGAVYVLEVGGEIDRYGALLARDPAAFQREESAHMRGTTQRFALYQTTELALSLGGVAAASYGVATGKGAWTGAGIGVTALALPLFVIDAVNNARAARYEERVRSAGPSLALGVAPGGGAAVSFGGAF